MRVKTLVSYLGLDTTPFVVSQDVNVAYLRGHQLRTADLTNAQKLPWTELARSVRYEGHLLRDLSMRYVYNRSVSHEAFQFAEDTSGYDSIFFTWNAADGFPWNLADYAAP